MTSEALCDSLILQYRTFSAQFGSYVRKKTDRKKTSPQMHLWTRKSLLNFRTGEVVRDPDADQIRLGGGPNILVVFVFFSVTVTVD